MQAALRSTGHSHSRAWCSQRASPSDYKTCFPGGSNVDEEEPPEMTEQELPVAHALEIFWEAVDDGSQGHGVLRPTQGP
ncbi:class II transactivator, isoform CRA_b [Mus musculus]|uniref:Class II transactivator n=1 Tax=Mus musculus TaxID=10090 RepID=A0A2R8W6Z7_MOUSE|nr:class II transactivator, isoform CRA_b [Mus musculus]